MYRHIGGRSPLNDITIAQAKALEEALNSSRAARNASFFLRVYVGMRYWHPFIEDTIKQIYDEGIRAVLAISLYPHYSLATAGSALKRFNDAIKPFPIESSSISSWYSYPRYIDALVDVIKKGMESFKNGSGLNMDVLFSAHSLPASIAESGDPYVSHIMGTIEEVAKRMDIKWHLSYQSKSGPVRWLGPSTEDKIRELAGKGVRNLLIVPISFVSDHIETLYEIDILYRELACGLGINMIRSEALNTRPLFIKALEEMVVKTVKELGWTG